VVAVRVLLIHAGGVLLPPDASRREEVRHVVAPSLGEPGAGRAAGDQHWLFVLARRPLLLVAVLLVTVLERLLSQLFAGRARGRRCAAL
jgi:hypothetical protein